MDDSTFAIITGCSIGGFLLLLAATIVICYACRVWRKKKIDEKNQKADMPVDDTTFTFQKPGMPPLTSGPGRPSSHLGGLRTTQAPSLHTVTPVMYGLSTSCPRLSTPMGSNVLTEVKVKNGSVLKRQEAFDKTSSNPMFYYQSTGALDKQRSSGQVEYTYNSSTDSVDGYNQGSYGSQAELIPRPGKPESKKKKKEKEQQKNQQKSSALPEPDMSVIAEETSSKLGIPQRQEETSVVIDRSQIIPAGNPGILPQPNQIHLRRSLPEGRKRPEEDLVERPRTVYPPADFSGKDQVRITTDAVIEIPPKTPVRATTSSTSTSEDKRLVLEAFSFLDEFDE